MHLSNKISKDVIHKPLERGRRVGEAKWHNQPLVGAITGFEHGFPLLAFSNSDEMVRMVEVDFGIDPSLPRRVQQIQYEREQVTIFFGDFIQCAEIDAKPKRAIFLFDEKNGCSV